MIVVCKTTHTVGPFTSCRCCVSLTLTGHTVRFFPTPPLSTNNFTNSYQKPPYHLYPGMCGGEHAPSIYSMPAFIQWWCRWSSPTMANLYIGPPEPDTLQLPWFLPTPPNRIYNPPLNIANLDIFFPEDFWPIQQTPPPNPIPSNQRNKRARQ